MSMASLGFVGTHKGPEYGCTGRYEGLAKGTRKPAVRGRPISVEAFKGCRFPA